MDPLNVIIAVTYIIGGLVSQVCFHAVSSYHENKPLGMQSFLSKVIILFANVAKSTAFFAATANSFLELHGPFSDHIATIIAVMECLFTLMFYSTLLIMTLTKYFSIYNGTFISELNELSVMKYLNGFIVLLPVVMASFEFTMWTKIEDTEVYQLLHTGNTGSASTLGHGKITLILANFLAAIILHGRIEFDIYRNNHTLGLIANVKTCFSATYSNDTEDYKLSIVRLVFSIVLLILVVFIAQVSQAVTIRVGVLFSFIFLGAVCPIIFIASHLNMRKHLIKMIKMTFGAKINF